MRNHRAALVASSVIGACVGHGPMHAQFAATTVCANGRTESGRLANMLAWDDPRNSVEAPSKLVGRVVATDGRPVDDVVLVVNRELVSAQSIAHTHTDSTGVFRIDSLPRGFVFVRVRRLAYLQQWQELHLLPGVTDTLCITLRAESVAPPSMEWR